MKKLIIFTFIFTMFIGIGNLCINSYGSEHKDEINKITERITKGKNLLNDLLVELNYIRQIVNHLTLEAKTKNDEIGILAEGIKKDEERLEELKQFVEDEKYL